MSDQPDLLQDASPDELRRMLEEDDDLPPMQRRWPQDLAALLGIVEGVLVRGGMPAEPAFKAATAAALEFARYGGGRLMYIPQAQRLRQALRDAEIWRRHNGRNQVELAQEFDLSVQSVYEILREQRALHTRKFQGQLFNQEAP